MVALFVVLTIITFLTIDYFVQCAEVRRAKRTAPGAAAVLRATAERSVPLAAEVAGADLFVSGGHAWVAPAAAGRVRVGPDRLAAALLGRPDRIDLLPAGIQVRAGDPLVRLHRNGRVLALRSPVDGVIESIRSAAAEAPASAAAAAPPDNWLYQLAVAPGRVAPALATLRSGPEAAAWMRDELGRLRDAIAVLAGAAQPAPAAATLQDGGEPIEGLADRLTLEEWSLVAEDFFGPQVEVKRS